MDAILFNADDFKYAGGLIVKLRQAEDPISAYLLNRLSDEMHEKLEAFDEQQAVSYGLQCALAAEFNALLEGESLYNEDRFVQITLPEDTKHLISQNPQGDDLVRLNRALIEASYHDIFGTSKTVALPPGETEDDTVVLPPLEADEEEAIVTSTDAAGTLSSSDATTPDPTIDDSSQTVVLAPEADDRIHGAKDDKEKPTLLFNIFKWTVYSSFVLLTLVAIGVLYLFYDLSPTIPQLPNKLDDIFSQPTEIYAQDKGEWVLVHTLGGNLRVPLDQISQHFKHGVIATEDANFYNHHGVDKRGMIRALIANIRAGQLETGQGGSTITQQLTRHLFFTREKRWIRKLREITAAMQIESRYSKDEILAAYCNNMYFGADAYGVEEAANKYFRKNAKDLTLGESALLAGLLQLPSRYNPYYHMDRALERRKVVLSRMVSSHFITEAQAKAAEEEEVVLQGTSIGPLLSRGPFFIDYVRDVIIEKYGSNLVYNGGLKIYTTMDLELQEIAERAVKNQLAALDTLVGDPVYATSSRTEQHNALEGALVSVDNKTGAIKALVGGRDYTNSEYNRAVNSNRQPGSGFKPFIYLSAIDKLGYTPRSLVVDEPISYTTDVGDEWEPKNFSRWHRGQIILKWALMRSVNVISAKLINEVGPETVVEYAQRLGVTSKLEPFLSLALGTTGISSLELAAAYAVFPNGGIYRKPHVVARVEDASGRLLDETIIENKRVIKAQSAYMMLDMLRGVILRGTGAGIPVRYGFTIPAGGKTGTSSDSKDVWFNGFTRELSTSVWVGYDDSRPLKPILERETTGASGAIPVWVDYMKNATDLLTERIEQISGEMAADLPKDPKVEEEKFIKRFEFPVPIGIEFTHVDIHTGGPPVQPDSVLSVAILGATPVVPPLEPLEPKIE